jgi:peptide/nickel transport system permease protein
MGMQPPADVLFESTTGPDIDDQTAVVRGSSWLPRTQLPIVSGVILTIFVLAGIFGPLIAPHDPIRIDLRHSLVPPVFAGGTWNYALGTDVLGRDVLSRMLGGARVSFLVAFTVVFISGSIGLMVAVLSGYLGGAVDAVLMRLTDATLAFPLILLAIVLASIFGASTQNVIIILAAGGWASYARVIRSEVLALKSQEFVSMAVVMGGGRGWIIARHIIPNVLSSLVVLATLQVGAAILSEGSLSFLGIGVPPPAPSWGGMLANGSDYLTTAWWLAVLPGVALSLTVLASNLMGDWLRSQSDPSGRR